MSLRLQTPINYTALLGVGQDKAACAGFVDPNGHDWLLMNDVQFAVNGLALQNSATGNAVVISIGGDKADANGSLTIQAAGTGTLTLGGASSTVAFGGPITLNGTGASSITGTFTTDGTFTLDASASNTQSLVLKNTGSVGAELLLQGTGGTPNKTLVAVSGVFRILSNASAVMAEFSDAGGLTLTSGLTVLGGNLSLPQNPAAGSATTIATNGTIVSTSSVQRVTSATAVSGIIVAAGTVAGQQLEILNTGTNVMTLAAAGTSNVSGGTANSIAGGSGLTLVWSSVEALWFPTGGGGGGGGTTTQVDQFLAQSGTTVTLTATVGNVLGVYVNGIAQRKTTDWSIAGQVITFVSTLASDDVIVVYTTSLSGLTGTVSVVEQEFANASGTTVTLSQTNISGVALVARNGVIQRQGVDYTINATTGVITFTTTLVSEQVSVAYWTGGAGTGNATTLNGFTTSQAPTSANVAVTNASGRLDLNGQYSLRSRTIINTTATTSYTIPSGIRALLVECTGGGGGGGGAGAAGASTGSGGGGGGGGSYANSFITSLPASPVTIQIGAGGSGATAGANNGGNGTDTTFNVTTVVGKGGTGGVGGLANGAGSLSGNGSAGAFGGTGDITINGGTGYFGKFPATNAVEGGQGGLGAGPYGGSSPSFVGYGTGGGPNGILYGGGGSGGCAQNSGGVQIGGAGAKGIMVIWEYE